jgi:hypothetical protein
MPKEEVTQTRWGTHLQLYLTVKAREHATLVCLHGANATRLHAIVTDADMAQDTVSLQTIASGFSNVHSGARHGVGA